MEGPKKQLGKVGFDTETGVYSGEVIFLYESETFHAESVEELRFLIHESVKSRQEESDRKAVDNSDQFFKRLVICLEPTLYQKLGQRADLAEKSLDDYIIDTLREVASKRRLSSLV